MPGGFPAISMRCGPEVAKLGSRRQVRAVHTDHDAAPRAVTLRVARSVTDGVLARQFVRDLSVDAGQFGELTGEERPRAGFLRELTQNELGLLEPLGRRSRAVGRAQADGVD